MSHPDHERLSGKQSAHDKPNKLDACKSSTSSLTKPTSSTNQPNQIELNGKHSNASASRSELKPKSNVNTVGKSAPKSQDTTIDTQNCGLGNSTEELNNVPDTTTTDIVTEARKSPLAINSIGSPKLERKMFIAANVGVAEQKPIEAAGIVIKKDYLPPPVKTKIEKTREDVTRVLNYDTEPMRGAAWESQSPATVKTETTQAIIKTEPSDTKISMKSGDLLSENKVDKVKKESGEGSSNTPIKTEFKSIESSTEKKESKSSRDEHRLSKSSSSKSTSHRSSSSSSRDCSRCYRRSKIKRVNVGVQCCKYGEPYKQMTPTSTPLKGTKTLASNMSDSIYSDLKYGRFFHIEVHPNGGASIVHMYQNEINNLSDSEMDELTEEFFRVVFSEDENGFAHHVMGIVHDAASYMPDLLEHMADNYSNLTVKAGVLGRNSDIETSTLVQYYEQVTKNYSHGTFRYGPLHQISLVGKVHEEVGGYFPDLLGRLEANPFLFKVSWLSFNCKSQRGSEIKVV